MSRTVESLAPEGIRTLQADPQRGGAHDVASDIGSTTPVPAHDLELLGTFLQSGHRRPPSLVRRGDGQIVQLTPVLYALLEAIDGVRDHAALARTVGERVGRTVAPEDVRGLVETRLRPLGLLQQADGSDPPLKKANPLLGLRFRVVVTDPRITDRIAAAFAKLFLPPVALALTIAYFAAMGWLLFDMGLASAARHALYEPGLLLLVFFLTTLSAGFHELGHAAACRYGGAKPGVMGVGLYLVWPAFYTDVTDAYRLDRRGRLRVDLGGIFFNAIFGVLTFGLWALTGWDALLIVVPLQLLQMVRQLVPLIRLDGYHILADLTGVPDLFAHIKPILTGLLPTNWGRSQANALRPWVRVVVTCWVLVVVPILLFMFAVIAITLPRLAATAWDSLGDQWAALGTEVAKGDMAGSGVRALSILALAIPILSMVYLLTRIIRRTARRIWKSTSGRPVKRGVASVLALGLIAGLVMTWWPHGQYRPIGPGERGSFVDVRFRQPPLLERLLGPSGVDAAGPTIPNELSQRSAGLPFAIADPSAGMSTSSEPPSSRKVQPRTDAAFPFPLPDPPEEGDNQALAVNRKDDSTLVDLAYSLLFVSEGVVDQANEAYALASCVDCLTVAIALQVIFILDQTNVAIPENLAVAVNASCDSCLTQAVAMQLIITASEPLTDEALSALEGLRSELNEIKADIEGLTPEEIYERLLAIEAAILDMLISEGIEGVEAVDDSELDGGSDTSVTDPDPLATPLPSASPGEPAPEPTPSDSPSPAPSGSPSPEPSPEPSGDPSPEPTPTSEPSP